MFPRRIALAYLTLAGLAACSADRPAGPGAELVDGAAGAITLASTITAEYDLNVGQTVRIVPRSTTRTNRLRWLTSNSRVASVNSNGVVSALANGTSTVTVSGSGVLESYAVVVAAPAPALTGFSLQPAASVTLNAGQTQQFTAAQTWSDGLTRTSGITFTATGGTISSSGLFTAGNLAGTFMVIASCSCGVTAIADTTPVVVAAVAQLTKLTISPDSVTLAPGGARQFSVSANWSTGATDVPPVTWSATGGTVSSTGAFVAPSAAGTYRVIVAHTGGTVADTALVTVTGGGTLPPPVSSTFGPGPNAPAWPNKTVYQEELFNVPIPVHFANANAAGFKGRQGFNGAWGATYTPTRVTYPIVDTPIGRKPVLQVTYPGVSSDLIAAGSITSVWPTDQAWAVRVTGTWIGTLVFERSADGVTWVPVSLEGSRAASGSVSLSGQQTGINGVWISNDSLARQGGLFRVRALNLTSGRATVAIGMQGGAAAARMNAGSFVGNPTRVYTRVLVYVDPQWTNGGNVGTKFFFFSQQQGNNHYTGLWGEAGARPTVGLQQTSSRGITGTGSLPLGSWLDVEYLFVANTPGASNGIVRAWINGQQLLSASDVSYFAAGTVPGFSDFLLDPTYGGGSAPPPRNTFFRIAGWYRESAP